MARRAGDGPPGPACGLGVVDAADRSPASRVGVPKAVRTRVCAWLLDDGDQASHMTWFAMRLNGWLGLMKGS